MENKEFNKPTLEIVDINENDVIATSGLDAKGALDDWFNDDGKEDW